MRTTAEGAETDTTKSDTVKGVGGRDYPRQRPSTKTSSLGAFGAYKSNGTGRELRIRLRRIWGCSRKSGS